MGLRQWEKGYYESGKHEGITNEGKSGIATVGKRENYRRYRNVLIVEERGNKSARRDIANNLHKYIKVCNRLQSFCIQSLIFVTRGMAWTRLVEIHRVRTGTVLQIDPKHEWVEYKISHVLTFTYFRMSWRCRTLKLETGIRGYTASPPRELITLRMLTDRKYLLTVCQQ